MNICTHLAVLLVLTVLRAAAEPKGCNYEGQNYETTDIIDHDNGCAKLQCQFGSFVIYYEACGKEIDGQCHRLNQMFEYEGNTYQCRKSFEAGEPKYTLEVVDSTSATCELYGDIYQALEKFKINCQEYQCQDGEPILINEGCDNSVDGECHLEGEIFLSNGLLYGCTRTEFNGEHAYENNELGPPPTKTKSCSTNAGSYDYLEIFRLPGTCKLRQCQNKIAILAQECLHKVTGLCYTIGEWWTFQDEEYECVLNETTGVAQIEIIKKSYAKCERREKVYDHLELYTRPDGCTTDQCQNGDTPTVDGGCFWKLEQKCQSLGLVWTSDHKLLKCILTEDLLYRIVELDENGNIIEKELKEAPEYVVPCPDMFADIIFILDSSGSMSSGNYEKQLNFSCKLISAFTIGPDNVRIGGVLFSSDAEKLFDLKTYDTDSSICRRLKRAPYLGQETETQKAFDLIREDEMFSTAAGGRPNSHDVIIIITDGNSSNTDIAAQAADSLKAVGILIFAIGVGQVSTEELNRMASGPQNVFSISNYAAINSLLADLSNRTCSAGEYKVEPPKPGNFSCPDTVADVIFLLDSSAKIGADNYSRTLELAVNIVNMYTYGLENVQFGAVLISSQPKVFTLNAYSNRDSIVEALQKAQYLQGERETAAALNLVLKDELFSEANGGRNNSARVLVTVLHGPSKNLDQTLARAKEIRNNGVQIISIGLDNFLQREVTGIAGNHRNVFFAASHELLNFRYSSLFTRLCEVTKEPRPGPEPPMCEDTVTSPCEQKCQNTNTGFNCSCIRGYLIDPNDASKCVDVNECEQSANLCEQICINTVGTYDCSCREGYTENSDIRSCTEVDPCINSPCQQKCERFEGRYKCSCNEGYTVSDTDPTQCKEVDPCINSPCQQKCESFEGRYECSCNEGYTVSDTDPTQCKDIDECLDVDNPPCHQICTNTEGSYSCSCKTGYTPNDCDPSTCRDINECETNPCKHTCINTRGSYRCSCPDE